GALPGYKRRPLQVPYPQCCQSQLRTSPLILGHLCYPRSLSLPGDAPYIPTPVSCRFPFILVAIWPSLVSIPIPDPELPFPSPLPLPPSSLSSFALMAILFPLLSKIQAFLLMPPFLFSFFGSAECSVETPYFMANIHL
ncbi:mCG144766, partial [Mus musculus]